MPAVREIVRTGARCCNCLDRTGPERRKDVELLADHETRCCVARSGGRTKRTVGVDGQYAGRSGLVDKVFNSVSGKHINGKKPGWKMYELTHQGKKSVAVLWPHLKGKLEQL